MRQLADAAPLEAWARGVEARGYDFVSYRLKDGTRRAFAKIEDLLAAEKAVFWDRWSLPRQLAETHRPANDAQFRAYLARIIQGLVRCGASAARLMAWQVRLRPSNELQRSTRAILCRGRCSRTGQ